MIEDFFKLVGALFNFIFWTTAVLFGIMMVFNVCWFILAYFAWFAD